MKTLHRPRCLCIKCICIQVGRRNRPISDRLATERFFIHIDRTAFSDGRCISATAAV